MDIGWDPRKAESNLRKHGVSFEEAATALLDPFAATAIDERIGDELREITIGASAIGRLLLVVHTLREHDTIRIISARKPTRKERAFYEEGI